MNEKMKSLRVQMEAKLASAKSAEGAEAKNALMAEYAALKSEYEAEAAIVEAEKAFVASQPAMTPQKAEEKKTEMTAYEKSCKALADAARNGFAKSMNETNQADGGYTVPEDISTKVFELRDAEFNLRQLVDVKPVKTLSGARTYKKRAQHTGFSAIGEAGKIPKVGKPEYARVEYKVVKYGGYMFATNELLADTDANIVADIIDWFAQESRVTGNKLILATLDEKYTRSEAPATAATIASIDDIKKEINVTLGQAFAPTTKIVTNDDGLQWLDTLKDGEDRSLLKVDENDPLKKYVSVGFRKVPLEIIPNSDLPTDSSKGIPVYMGDFKEACKFFDRKSLSIKSSDVAAIGDINAFGEDLTVWRGLEREDCVLFDEAAYVKGWIAAVAG